MNWSAFVWIFLMVMFLAMESSTVTLVSIWFACGALVALIVSLFGLSVWVETAVFLGVSCLMLALLRPIVRKYVTPKITKTNIDSIIGSVGLVTESIENIEAKGQVKLGAVQWSARSTTGADIPEGTLIRVDRIEGVKVFVTPK